MGVGHLAVGFAAKRWAPRTSLAWLMLAPVLVDLFWSVFVLLGIERAHIDTGIAGAIPIDLEYMPYSHSLIAVLAWGAAFAGLYYALQRDAHVAAILFVGVFSHWLLDWISHRPDMALLPGGARFGLALWDHPLVAFCTEALMLALGIGLYARVTRARSHAGVVAFALIVIFLFAINVGAYAGPPPPSVTPMAAGNLSLIVLLALLYLLDRRRESRAA
jgi:hypothetical protein